MNITNNNYRQLHDYLTQLIDVSNQNGIEKITQIMIGNLLKVDNSGVCRFLKGETKRPKKMLTNFVEKYPDEFKKWKKDAHTIGRLITKNDCSYFLNPTKMQNQEIVLDKPILVKLPAFEPKVAAATICKLNEPTPSEIFKTINPTIRETIKNPQNPLVAKKGKWARKAIPNAPIAISYRGHLSDKDAQGAIFDHHQIQKLLNISTRVVMPDPQEEGIKAKKLLAEELRNLTFQLRFDISPNLNTCRTHVHKFANFGLLIIPGRAKKIENESVRLNHEYKIIRDAFNRGQPMLGICAGSWRIYEQLIICTQHPNALNNSSQSLLNFHAKNKTLIEVSDHSYGGGMVRLNSSGKVNYNVQIHDIVIEDGSLLKSSLGKKYENIKSMIVNSVHWKAVNADSIKKPLNINISAVAAQNPSNKMSTRQSTLMLPEENSVEGFESHLGVPIMGIQWHPEAYKKKSPHVEILNYMFLAGNAYAAKRRMLKEMIERNQ